jgi:hypothetical protein
MKPGKRRRRVERQELNGRMRAQKSSGQIGGRVDSVMLSGNRGAGREVGSRRAVLRQPHIYAAALKPAP